MTLVRRGCQTCRKRRVKCDVVQPVCGRCVKASRDCVWDPNNHQGLHFKSENAFAQGQASRRPNRPRNQHKETEKSSLRDGELSIPIDVLAFAFYVRNFLFQPSDLRDFGHEYTVFVLPLWRLTKPDSSLHLAIHAVSHAVFGREKRLQKAIDQAATYHSRCIETLRQDMSRSRVPADAAKSDHALLIAAMLMCTYEDVMLEDTAPSGSCYDKGKDPAGAPADQAFNTHQTAIELLELLQHEERERRNLSIERAVRRSMNKRCLLHGTKISDSLCSGAAYGEEVPVLDLDVLLVRVGCLRAESLDILLSRNSNSDGSPDSPPLQALQTLAREAEDLDESLSAWPGPAAVHEEWNFSVEVKEESFPRGYATYAHASVWNTCRTARIMVNGIRIKCLSRWLSCTSTVAPTITTTEQERQRQQYQQLGHCQQTLHSIVDDLCASIPFFLQYSIATRQGFEQVTAEKRLIFSNARIVPKVAAFLAWPLSVAVSCSRSGGGGIEAVVIGDIQRQRLVRVLETVADALHDSTLKSIVEQEHQQPS